MRYIGAALIALLLFTSAARADDFGPARDVRDVDAAAKRLLAHRIRPLATSAVTISDTVVVKDQAVLTWRAGSQEALMGLVRYAGRWWDALDEVATEARTFDPLLPECVSVTSAFPLNQIDNRGGVLSPVRLTGAGMTTGLADAALAHNGFAKALEPRSTHVHAAGNLTMQGACISDFLSVAGVPQTFSPTGGLAWRARDLTAGYQVSLHYAANNAPSDAQFTSLRARAPTPSEILPLNAPFADGGYGTGVVFLYIDTDAKTSIAFQKGGSLDIWVPWALNDSLRYELELYAGKTTVGPIKATLFDNVLHFDLPAFSLPPGETMGEVDGYF